MGFTTGGIISMVRNYITDPTNRQNTALKLRTVLEKIATDYFNKVSDKLPINQVEGLSDVLAGIQLGDGFTGVEVERITALPYTTAFPTTYAKIIAIEFDGTVQRKPNSGNSYAPDNTLTVGSGGRWVVDVGTNGVVRQPIEGQIIYVKNGSSTGDVVAPTAPGTPSVVYVTSTTVSLTWAASSDAVGVVGYEVFNGSVSLGISTVNNIVISGLTPSTAYAVTVKARDAVGNVSVSSGVRNFSTSATTPGTAPPDKITTLVLTKLDNALRLDWSAPSDNGAAITGYAIRGRAVGAATWVNVPTTALLTATFSGLPPASNFEYQVAPINSEGQGLFSDSAIAAPLHPDILFEFVAKNGVSSNADTWTPGNLHVPAFAATQPNAARRLDFSTAATNGAVVVGDKGMGGVIDLSSVTEFTFQLEFIADTIPSTETKFPVAIGAGATAGDFNFYIDGSPVLGSPSKRVGVTVGINGKYWYETTEILEGTKYHIFLHWKLGELPTIDIVGPGTGPSIPSNSQPVLADFATLSALRNNFELAIGALDPLGGIFRAFPGKIFTVRLLNHSAMLPAEITQWVFYTPAPSL